eukprot:COSAG04_NODE_18798_length_432_cov_1.009009_2_plen_60_part_01
MNGWLGQHLALVGFIHGLSAVGREQCQEGERVLRIIPVPVDEVELDALWGVLQADRGAGA